MIFGRFVQACGLLTLLVAQGCCSAPRGGTAGQPVAAELPGTVCRDCSGLSFYFTGDVFLHRAEELIESARDYILIDSFLTTEDEKGKRVIDRLARAAARGVRVHLITDSSSAYVLGRTAVPYLRAVGIPTVEFNPIRCNRALRLPGFLYRDHRKFWLIDGETIVLGGQNITSTSLDSPAEGGHTDSMVEFRSQTAFRELLSSFVAEWNAYSTIELATADFAVLPQPPSGGGELRLVDQDGLADPVVDELFAGLLQRAHREVWLVQSYTIPSRHILELIRQTAARGVTVNILYSSHNVHEKFHYAPAYRMIDLIEAGARLWYYDHPTSHLHYKAVIVDGHWFTLGSANLNFRSLRLSKELNVLFEGEARGAPVLSHLEELKARSSRIEREQALEYRGPLYLFYYLLLFLGG